MDRKVDGLSLKTDHYSLFYFTGQVVIIVMGPGDCWLVHSVASCLQEQNSCLPPYSKNLTVIDISFREVNELMETILFTFSISFK